MPNVYVEDFAFAFAEQIDDALVSFEISSPGFGSTSVGDHSDANEGEEGEQDAPRVGDQKRIAAEPAELHMELEIVVEQNLTVAQGKKPDLQAAERMPSSACCSRVRSGEVPAARRPARPSIAPRSA